MFFKILLAIAIITVILIYRSFLKNCTCREKPTLIRDIPQATAILKYSKLLSRALPNQRLARVFSINNPFTTDDQVYYQTFLATTKSLLKTSDESIFFLAKQTLILAQKLSSSTPTNEITPLSPLIQVLCFRFASLKFFPKTHLSPSSTSSIILITKVINSPWVSSKRSCALEPSQIFMQDLLFSSLGQLFPPSFAHKHDNPLTILLPAYETLWRVVLRCFLEVSSRHPSDITTEWKDIFENFLANPTSKQFSKRKGRFSVQDIVFESLRLYPPTKRIHRQNCENGGIFAVDVEYLQRSKEIWGTNGNEFKPDRWWILERGEDAKYKEAWMSVGKGSFQFPALKVAPMMIGVLVGCLLHTFSSDEWVLEGGDPCKKAIG